METTKNSILKKTLLSIILLITSLFTHSFGQITFQKVYSGMESEWAGQAIECIDGSYALLGTTRSFGAGYDDICLIKTDINGNLLWARTYGESLGDLSSSFEQTPDGGFIIVGYTSNFGAGGNTDLYVIKVDENGEEIWSKVYHGEDRQQPQSVKLLANGGYVVAGFTRSFGQGNKDYFMLELDEFGNVNWSKTYGKEDVDDLYSMEQTDDGGYILCGGSGDFDPTGTNVHLVKIDSEGDTLWTKAYKNESIMSIGFSAKQTSDGGYIIGSVTGDGFVLDYYVIRTDALGDTLWTKLYSPSYCDDWCKSIRETEDGGFIMSGYSGCEAGIMTVKIDANGDILWDKKYDGLFNNTRIETTTDNGFLMLTWDELDETGYDMRMVKTDENGISGCSESSLDLTANSTSGLVKSGPVVIEDCPWEVVIPATISGIAHFIDSTICYDCDSVSANFSYTIIDGEVVFDNESLAGSEWSWDFGDGNTSNEHNPTNIYSSSGVYTVCLTANNPLCGEDSICHDIIIEIDQSGLLEQAKSEIFIYPNPTKGFLTVHANTAETIREVQILSLSGQCIIKYRANSDETAFGLDLNSLSKGVYFIAVYTTEGVQIEKVIRE